MNLVSSEHPVILLLALSAVCLGTWANTFKLAGTRWRFELFYLDFSAGALCFSILAALVFGNFGSELGVSDRFLISGRMAQASAFGSGIIFNIGNLSLLGAVSLLGMSTAFPISFGTALLVSALFNFRGDNALVLSCGIALMLIAVILSGRASQLRDGGSTVSTRPGSIRSAPSARERRLTKGLIASVSGGLFLGFFYPIAVNGVTGDLGLGSYAGMLFFGLGVLVSTGLLELCFLGIAIEGGPVRMSAYRRGQLKQHLLGVVGGVVCAWGVFLLFVTLAHPGQRRPSGEAVAVVPIISVLLAISCGIWAWKEFAKANGRARLLLAGTAFAFLCALVLLANTWQHTLNQTAP